MYARRKVIVATAALAASFSYLSTNFAGLSYTTFDVPNSLSTQPMGISQDSIVGSFIDSSYYSHGFLKKGDTYTIIDSPTGGGVTPRSVSGNTVVGNYYGTDKKMHGFIYANNQFSTLDAPNATYTYLTGVYDDTIVGYYTTTDTTTAYGFVYSNNQFTYLTSPYGDTHIMGIYQNTILGFSNKINSVFTCTDSVYTKYPMALSGTLFASGIYENTVVGWHTLNGTRGFYITDTNLFPNYVVVPNSYMTFASGIYQNTIVGYYSDNNTSITRHGFLASIDVPEPASLPLLASACLLLVRRSRK